MDDKFSFIISRDDWSLQRKGQVDQERHKQKIKEALKNSLGDLISEESIIMSNGKDIIKFPIKSLEQYKFKYNYGKQDQVGQGQGNSQTGNQAGQPGRGEQAGDAPGEDYYETEVDIDELSNLLFEDLELPNLQTKKQDKITEEEIVFNDIRKQGIMGNLDKRKTIFESMKRQYRQTGEAKLKIIPEDLRFKTWNEIEKPKTNAIVFAMMDTSGSMGIFEKYCSRSLFFWISRFLRTKYENVEIIFLAHHTQAKEVTEEQFFNKGESGGTMCSSVYQLANRMIDEKYPPSEYNIYAFYVSDGDNLTSDNAPLVRSATELLKKCNMVGYAEVNQHHRQSTLLPVMKQIEGENFVWNVLYDKKDVYPTLKKFFKKREEK